MARIAHLLLLSAVPSAYASRWCFGAPLSDPRSSGWQEAKEFRGMEFRGAFRDLSLWLEDHRNRDASCERFGDLHSEGNDGLWVIEFDEEGLMHKEHARFSAIGVDVKAVHARTIIVGGGEAAADLLGYDACGAEENKRFISVPTQEVRGPRAMPAETKKYYSGQLSSAQPLVLDLLNVIDQERLIETISHLEAYTSRNSFSGANGLDDAVEWAELRLRNLGFETFRHAFRSDMTPQVTATFPGTEDPESIVVVGAHFDSRGTQNSSPTQRAPGADDNASGSASILELARIINATGATFRRTLKLCLFTGEEQGLIGSRALALKMAKEGEKVVAMFNADMIGYAPEGADIVLAYMNRYADVDLTELSRKATELYVPEVQTALTNVCCSDQQSFYENGYASVGFFETPNASVVYPQYHKSNDLLENLSAEKIYLMTKATLASAIVFAEPASVNRDLTELA